MGGKRCGGIGRCRRFGPPARQRRRTSDRIEGPRTRSPRPFNRHRRAAVPDTSIQARPFSPIGRRPALTNVNRAHGSSRRAGTIERQDLGAIATWRKPSFAPRRSERPSQTEILRVTARAPPPGGRSIAGRPAPSHRSRDTNAGGDLMKPPMPDGSPARDAADRLRHKLRARGAAAAACGDDVPLPDRRRDGPDLPWLLRHRRSIEGGRR